MKQRPGGGLPVIPAEKEELIFRHDADFPSRASVPSVDLDHPGGRNVLENSTGG